jgi:biopolymer transport protein TolQ
MMVLQGFGSFVSLISGTGFVGQLVLLSLVAFSVGSWSIIYRKYKLYKESRYQSVAFHRKFRESSSLSAIQEECGRFPLSPLAGIFKAAYYELQQDLGVEESGSTVQGETNWIGLERSIRRSAQTEMTALESSLGWLATTAAVTPFIGLFGTVVGIINAFQGLGQGGASTIQAVAPGISEALVATAAGLFAAIPAVIAYNHFINDLKVFGVELDDFSVELLNLLERSFQRS